MDSDAAGTSRHSGDSAIATLLTQGALTRLAGVLVIIVLLWAAVGWALDWWS
jgi:hypothetical protein